MLNLIKSSFFVKILLCHLNEKGKLDLVRYNKNLQNITNINIINYKIFSGRYIELGLNGKAKEYSSYTDNIIFEGEYKNKKRNGLGKEYYENNKIRFIGEYKNGKRNGKGKEFNEKGWPIFEGEYLNGNRWNGNGREFNQKKQVIFNGTYLQGKKWNGKICYSNDKKCTIKKGKGLFKDYFFNGKLKFEEYYLDGEKQNIKGYDQFGNVIYKLENGNGTIKEYDAQERLIFEG